MCRGGELQTEGPETCCAEESTEGGAAEYHVGKTAQGLAGELMTRKNWKNLITLKDGLDVVSIGKGRARMTARLSA